MDEFISLIQFQTAMPFGYLMFFMGWLALSIWVTRNIIALVLKKKYRSPKLYLMLSILVLNVCYVYANIYYSNNLDFNPIFSESELIGEWIDGESSIVLLENGRAKIFLSPEHSVKFKLVNGNGYWYKENDFNLIIGSDAISELSKNEVFRVIRYGNNYRIIFKDYEDLDMWDGHLGFKQENM